MNVCLYGASKENIDESYKTAVSSLTERLARRGHALVFGGGRFGLMGAAARGMTAGEGKITGIAPEFFKHAKVEHLYDKCDEVITCDTMYERKQLLEEHADSFLIVPGGMGTYDEFFGVLTTKQLGRHVKPIAIYNVNGFFDCLKVLIDDAINRGFVRVECKELYFISDSQQEIIDYLENPPKITYEASFLKK